MSTDSNVGEHRTEGNDAGQHAIFLKAGQIVWSRPIGAVGHKKTRLVQLELGGTTHDNKDALITSLFQRLGITIWNCCVTVDSVSFPPCACPLITSTVRRKRRERGQRQAANVVGFQGGGETGDARCSAASLRRRTSAAGAARARGSFVSRHRYDRAANSVATYVGLRSELFAQPFLS